MNISLGPRIRNFLVIFLLIFNFEVSAKENGESYGAYVQSITKSFAKMMEEELGLVCIGTGGQMPHDVAMISVMFMSKHPASMDEVRNIEILASQKFLSLINNNEKVRPFLREFPFKSDRIDISVSFYDENCNSYFDGIAFACLVNDKITYYRFDKEEDNLIEIAEEPYEEALKKYQN